MLPQTYNKITESTTSLIPLGWTKIKTIDMHTGGEPLRVILGGLPAIEAKSVLAYRRALRDNHDHLRKFLINEPRGHADMYGCILTPPNDDEGDFGIVFIHNEGYSTMCGHAIIAISTLAVQMKWVNTTGPQHILKIDAPCGRITSYVDLKDGEVERVRFHCVPSFVSHRDIVLDIPQLGKVRLDVAYGGAFYAYVNMEDNNFDFGLDPTDYRSIIDAGMKIKNAVIASSHKVIHPLEPDLSFLYGTIFMQKSTKPGIDSRNVCVFADGEVDRCPTGSGVAGRMALHYVKKDLAQGQKMRIESITDSIFEGSVVKSIKYGDADAVIPEVAGTAYITGIHEFVLDPKDPFPNGFFLR